MSEPREFWVTGIYDETIACTAVQDKRYLNKYASQEDEVVHVIEKFAFDAMEDERDRMYDLLTGDTQSLLAERDALAESLREAVMALEQYSHIPIANDPFNTSSAKSNSFSPAADALSKLKIKHPEILK